jgi:hypothetical protein
MFGKSAVNFGISQKFRSIKLHYKIVDVLPVQTSVDIFNLEESDILLVMLGSVDQDIIQELSMDRLPSL